MKRLTTNHNPLDALLLWGALLSLGGCTNSVLEPPTLALGLTTLALLLLRKIKKN